MDDTPGPELAAQAPILNRRNWDERVPIHLASPFYDVEGFVVGASDPLRPFEIDEVGDVVGRRLVHLQCHFGLDSLAWGRRGARVTGLDFSGPAVDAAQDLAVRCDLDARFVHADVYDAVHALGGETFDVVYTGLGAVNWLADIERWAGVVASLVAPGGFFYLAEFHPFTNMFGDDDLSLVHGYFDRGPRRWDDEVTYTGDDTRLTNTTTVETGHTLGDVISAIVGTGLCLEFLHEHDYTLFPRIGILERSDRDTYRLPQGAPSVPWMYSLRARTPDLAVPQIRASHPVATAADTLRLLEGAC